MQAMSLISALAAAASLFIDTEKWIQALSQNFQQLID
jgi:hypothetical protein